MVRAARQTPCGGGGNDGCYGGGGVHVISEQYGARQAIFDDLAGATVIVRGSVAGAGAGGRSGGGSPFSRPKPLGGCDGERSPYPWDKGLERGTGDHWAEELFAPPA